MVIELEERTRAILLAVIDDFIRIGGPVGSRTISKRGDIDISPATIRNIMADLEEIGFLVQPHTSAGRIPTELAIRFYIDSILEITDLTDKEKERIKINLNPKNKEIKDLVRDTSRVLSEISHYASVVSTPRFSHTVFKVIDFIKVSNNKILAILVSRTGLIYNKIIADDEDLNQDKLNWMSNYLNDILSNLTLEGVREKILQEMESEKTLYDELLMKALTLSKEVIDEQVVDEELFIEGSAYIFDYPEFSDIEKMKSLFHAFEKKHNLIRLLDKVAMAEGIKIFIGSESNIISMNDCALVASPYRKGDRILGSIGIIGPKRMNYSKIIPIVDFSASLVSRILDDEY